MEIEDSYKRHIQEQKEADRAFQRDERYRMGKLSEVRMFGYLHSIGFHVTDISMEKTEHNYWPPFDILAESKYYSFFADVKYRSSRGGYPVDSDKVDWWLAYNRPDTIVNDRIVIICTPGRQDSIVSVPDMQEFYMFANRYMLPRESMKSIVILRKVLEHSNRDSTPYTLSTYRE